MKKKAGISTVMMILFLVLIMNRTGYAADFNASVSSANASQGENVSVTVTFSSGANIGAYAMKLTYDADIWGKTAVSLIINIESAFLCLCISDIYQYKVC